MLVVVLRGLVAHDAHRLAAERAADHRAVLPGLEQCVLVARGRARFGRRDEARPDPHAVGSQHEGGGEAAAVEDAAGSDDGHAVADRVDDLRHQRERRDQSGVPARLGALRDDEVATGLDGGDRMTHLAAHVDDEHVVAMAQVDDLARYAEPGDEDGRALRDEQLDVAQHVGRQGGEQVDAERVARQLLRLSDLVDHLVAGHRDAPRHPKPPASDTAATSRWYDTPPMPASITGCSMPSMSVSRVLTSRH